MSDQAQCPNCGGYKVYTEKQEPITETKKVPMSFGKALLSAIGGIIAWGILGGFCSLTLVSTGVNGWWIPLLLVALLSAVILFILIPLSAIEASKGTLSSNKVIKVGTYYHLYCQLCGYRWNWDNRTPYPKATVRPDLIEQGEQRLEEEHRKQQQDAAALYYLTHRK